MKRNVRVLLSLGLLLGGVFASQAQSKPMPNSTNHLETGHARRRLFLVHRGSISDASRSKISH
jgi:hypothetical protein